VVCTSSPRRGGGGRRGHGGGQVVDIESEGKTITAEELSTFTSTNGALLRLGGRAIGRCDAAPLAAVGDAGQSLGLVL
jgi:hypothetical protein